MNMEEASSSADVFKQFLIVHEEQLKKLEIPVHFWQTLCFKCHDSVFDAGNAFSFEAMESMNDEQESQGVSSNITNNSDLKVCVVKDNGISPDDKDQIYLIDHAYTYHLQNVRAQLLKSSRICYRLAEVMGICIDKSQPDKVVSTLLREMWRFNQKYNIVTNSSDVITVWYIMDEFGLKIRHCKNPSFRVVPFFYMGHSTIAYSLLYPLKKVNFGDEVTRNYIESEYDNELMYKALILPWEDTDFTYLDFTPEEPSISFIQSGRIEESTPEFETEPKTFILSANEKLKVYCDYQAIKDNLNHSMFELVSSEKDANVLWLNYHYKEFRELTDYPQKYINQFPFEHILTCKDLLAVVCRRAVDNYIADNSDLSTNPPWLPTTYNLNTELFKFISYFQQRNKKGLDNTWICKPWNSSRGRDVYITDNLSCILKLRSIGPMIASKYITDPVLFPVDDVGLVKMDIRYIVLLKSAKPLQLYIYKNFWLRFANKPFDLNSFEDYEKHFTLMNYYNSTMKQMYCNEFIKIFENYYPQKWADVEKEIFCMLKNIFTCATLNPPPAGLFQDGQCRAMYGIDLMLKWNRTISGDKKIQPVILEVNFSPDCTRACQYYPDFFNDVFETLFLNEMQNSNVILL